MNVAFGTDESVLFIEKCPYREVPLYIYCSHICITLESLSKCVAYLRSHKMYIPDDGWLMHE